MIEYDNLDEACRHLLPPDESVAGLQALLRATFFIGAIATLRLLEEGGHSLTTLRIEVVREGAKNV